MNASADSSTTAPAEKPVYESGTWQATLDKSATLFDRSGKARKQASALLWDGGQEAINEWMESGSDTDVHAEVFYADVLDILGKSRKGDASKIKSVALAVKNNGLVLSLYPNLSKAYAEANRLTKTVQQNAAEDSAAEEAVAEIQANAPKSSSTPEGAALIVLSQGVDEAARLLLDALGATNTAAHRSLMRAISQEIAGRVPKPAPKPAAKKATVKKSTAKKATVKSGAAKPKPAAKGAAKKAAATAAKPKPKPVAVEASEGDGPAAEDMFDSVEDVLANDAAVVEQATKPAKPKPVRRGERATA